MAILALGIGRGDEVIMPSFTFVSSANAVVMQGTRPVFAEILPGTLNLDPDDVRTRITPRTKAIIVVHYAGVSCDMDAFMQISTETGIPVIEDAAQGVDAFWRGRALGSIGQIGCFSFHDTKNITCGEGGAFLTNDSEVARKTEIIREKGTNRSAFLRGEVDKYTWIGRGSSYVQSEILAAVLMAQLEKRARIRELRKSVWEAYFSALSTFADNRLLTLPVIPPECTSNYHTFFVNTTTLSDRDPLLETLKKQDISASFHYVPLHSSPFGKNQGGLSNSLPKTDFLADSLIRLPLYPSLLQEHPDAVERVTAAFSSYFQ